MDTRKRKVIRKIATAKNPETVRVRGRYAYVASEPASAGSPGSPPPPDDEANLPAKLIVIDMVTKELVHTVDLGTKEAEAIEFSGDGGRLLVAHDEDQVPYSVLGLPDLTPCPPDWDTSHFSRMGQTGSSAFPL